MEWTREQRVRETDVFSGLIREGLEGTNNFRKVSKLMRKKGMIGHDEYVIAVEYYPFKVVDNLRVIVGRSKKVDIDKV